MPLGAPFFVSAPNALSGAFLIRLNLAYLPLLTDTPPLPMIGAR